ncbi:MAG: F0F1 ATP synthase subunit A [Atopobiaceae bacterium]|nr:F0F1 ATP synthase subunit A [Atopobiaceae bacterium]
MTLTVQKEVPSIIIITLLLCALCVYAGKKIKEADPYEKPKGIVFGALWFVEWIDGMVATVVRPSYVERMAPYIGVLTMYLLCANLSGLFGFNAPTMNFSVTLSLALITWVLIQRAAFKTNGILGYFRGLFEPIPLLVLGNVAGKFAPLISMSMRLFGNILSGSIIMSLIYMATSALSNLVLGWIGVSFNVFGVVVAPVFHAYFDVFSGFIQMFIFISLTMAFVSNELGDE